MQKERIFMQLARTGLSVFFQDLNWMSAIDKYGLERIGIEKHPFDLEIEQLDSFTDDNVYFLAHPGRTDLSVSTMIAHIRWSVADNVIETATPLRLRIILAENSEGRNKGHNVYFEFRSVFGTFICGGCTDYSGGGGAGRAKMKGLFTLLSLVYDVEIEEITIPYCKAKVMEEKIRQAVDVHQMERSKSYEG